MANKINLNDYWSEDFERMNYFISTSSIKELNDQLMKSGVNYLRYQELYNDPEGTKSWLVGTEKMIYKICRNRAEELNMDISKFPEKLENLSLDKKAGNNNFKLISPISVIRKGSTFN